MSFCDNHSTRMENYLRFHCKFPELHCEASSDTSQAGLSVASFALSIRMSTSYAPMERHANTADIGLPAVAVNL